MKKTYILNIGLETSLNFHNEVMQIDLEGIKNAITDAGLVLEGDIVVRESNTEQTAILRVGSMVELEGASVYPEIYDLSVRLMQDCIACYNVDEQEGQLIGRHANEWGGVFNPAYFLLG